MWKPSGRQWSVIWSVVLVLVLLWPPSEQTPTLFTELWGVWDNLLYSMTGLRMTISPLRLDYELHRQLLIAFAVIGALSVWKLQRRTEIIDADGLNDSHRNAIRIWAKMIRQSDEERAVKFLTWIVTNLAGDKQKLDTIIAATKDKPLN